jgi:Ohr subfamily peroxiredoxin
MPDKVLYTAEATSSGDGRSGHVASSDHRLDFDLARPTEMGGDGNGTNPEQLFAAGYSACFHSALRVVARRAKVDPGDSTVTAQVGIAPLAAISASSCAFLEAGRWVTLSTMDLAAIEAERARLHDQYIKAERPSSSARGIHHTALLSSDVERTIRFYQGILEFPLTEIIENRDYEGSSHFFFDVGNGNLLAFFDFPGLGLGPYAEVLGGLHHLAISVTPEKWAALRANLEAAGVEYMEESGASLYFRDPDGARLELLADPLGEMYGSHVL